LELKLGSVTLQYGCCGVDSVTSSHNDFRDIPSDWWNSWLRGSDVIPNSCCQDVSIYTYLFLYNNDCTVYLKKSEYKTEVRFSNITYIAYIVIHWLFSCKGCINNTSRTR